MALCTEARQHITSARWLRRGRSVGGRERGREGRRERQEGGREGERGGREGGKEGEGSTIKQ